VNDCHKNSQETKYLLAAEVPLRFPLCWTEFIVETNLVFAPASFTSVLLMMDLRGNLAMPVALPGDAKQVYRQEDCERRQAGIRHHD
jgi:hypothetical protein